MTEVTSTSDVIKDLLKEITTSYLLITADTQSKGRGTYNKYWYSEPGGLYFSLAYKLDSFKDIQIENITVRIAKIVKEIIYTESQHKTEIEWPNDIILNNKKCAGILVENCIINKNKFQIIGIGININQQTFPEEIKHAATSLFIESNKKYDIDIIKIKLKKEILKMYAQYPIK